MVRTKITTGDVMQAAYMEVSQDATPAEQVQRHVQLLELEQSEMECSFIDESFFTKKGIVLQFINNNCAGATSLIGGLRLALDDLRKIPAYLEKNTSRLKHYAIKCLDRHIKGNQCVTGAGERLTFDDYGISYSLASVSQRGTLLNPSKRQEGQLFFCLFPGLVEPFFMGTNPDGTEDMAHIINVFIHLMPSSQRRSVYLQKLDRETPSPTLSPATSTSATTAPIPIPSNNAHSNKRHKSHRSRSHKRNSAPVHDSPSKFKQRIETVERELQTVKNLQLPTPPLPPISAPPLWRHDGAPGMPEQ